MDREVIADTLEKAAEHVRNGWCQGTISLGDSVCAIGAIYRATGKMDGSLRISDPEFDVIVDAERTLELVIKGSVAMWNDHPARTQGEVVELFLHTAKDLRNGPIER